MHRLRTDEMRWEENRILSIQRINFVRRLVEKEGCASLTALLRISEQKLVTDPRDRVNGLLALMPMTFRERITVDYQKSSEDDLRMLYMDCVRKWLEEETGLDILKLASGRQPMLGLPSWCPVRNWSTGRDAPSTIKAILLGTIHCSSGALKKCRSWVQCPKHLDGTER
jgi:hypothetical protein